MSNQVDFCMNTLICGPFKTNCSNYNNKRMMTSYKMNNSYYYYNRMVGLKIVRKKRGIIWSRSKGWKCWVLRRSAGLAMIFLFDIWRSGCPNQFTRSRLVPVRFGQRRVIQVTIYFSICGQAPHPHSNERSYIFPMSQWGSEKTQLRIPLTCSSTQYFLFLSLPNLSGSVVPKL